MSFNISYKLLFFLFWCNLIAAQSSFEILFKEEKYNELVERITAKERNEKLTINEYFYLSKSYSKLDRQFESLLILNNIIPQLIALNDIQNLAIAYNLKSENLVDLDKADEGAVFCNNAITELEEKEAPYVQELCLKCGILYNLSGAHEKAYDVFQKIDRKKIKETMNYVSNYAFILVNTERFDTALRYLKKAADISFKTDDKKYAGIILHNIGRVFIKQKKWKEARKYLDSASLPIGKSGDVNERKKLYITYYNYFLHQREVVKSKIVLERIDELNKRIYTKRIDRRTKELATINSRKNILNKRVSVISSELETRKETRLIIFILLITVVMILTSWVLFIRYRNTKLKYEQVVNEQELLSSQMTPHFIFNALSILQGMVLNKEQKNASLYVSKFANILGFITKSTGKSFISLQQEISILKDYVDLQNLSTKKNIQFIIKKEFEEEVLIPSMILQPFIENSIIHGFKEHIENPTITINFKLKDKIIDCTITDNGVGLLSGEKKQIKDKTSLATQIVEDRFEILSQKLNDEFFVTIQDLKFQNKKGTLVNLQLPYQKNKSI